MIVTNWSTGETMEFEDCSAQFAVAHAYCIAMGDGLVKWLQRCRRKGTLLSAYETLPMEEGFFSGVGLVVSCGDWYVAV